MKAESSTLSKGAFMSSPEATIHQPLFVNQQHSGSDTHEPTSIESALMAIQDYMKSSHETMLQIGKNIASLEDRISKIKTIQNIPTQQSPSIHVAISEKVTKFVIGNKRILLISATFIIICGAAAKYWKR